jgi:hypothetical protein
VSGAPVITKKPNPEIFTPEKKAVKVEFEVNGLPQPEIQWFKNDEPLVLEPRIKTETRMKTIYALSIDNSNLNDAGKYTLKAKNDSGEASESFNLIVQSIFLILFNFSLSSFRKNLYFY